ncbi:MAG: helix-turn-helix transcriptional regulator [Rhodobacteraceae bacterium]|nr:helix-turn-helix transcriptional regulator [Paracoccaceae bacterium]
MGQNVNSKSSSADSLQDLPLQVVSYQKCYADGYHSTRHNHPRHQLIYAVSGLMMAETESARWAVPAGYGLIVCAETFHQTRMIGEVRLQSLYVNPNALINGEMETSRIITITPLLAALIAELCALANPTPISDKAHHLGQLILIELATAPTSPLALPYPEHSGLRRVCDALVANPATGKTIDHWAHEIGASRRSFTRKFQQQTGISFRQWTQRLRCQIALQALAGGTPIQSVARDLGYASPYALRAMMQRHI